MIIQREYPDERLDRICHVLEHAAPTADGVGQNELVAIDEDHLSWFYIAPGSELTALSQQLLSFARDLLGPRYWAVLQVHELDPCSLMDAYRCRVFESFVDCAGSSESTHVHIVQGE